MFNFDIPRMVCAADVEAGQERLREAIEAIDPVKRAIARAEGEMLMIGACDLVEGAKGLETVRVGAEMRPNDEGGSYVSLCVGCEYVPSDEEEPNIEYELHDLLCEIGEDIYCADMCDRSLNPNAFLKELAELVLDAEPARAWFAAREAASLSASVTKTGKNSKAKLL